MVTVLLFATSFAAQQNISNISNPLDQLTCSLKGENYFMAAKYFVCQMPVSDEGKSCIDYNHCQDICKANAEEDTKGICTSFSHDCDIVLVEEKIHRLCS